MRKRSKIVPPSAIFPEMAKLVEELADRMSPTFKLEVALECALDRLDMSCSGVRGNALASQIRRFLKCTHFSQVPSDLQALIRKANELRSVGSGLRQKDMWDTSG